MAAFTQTTGGCRQPASPLHPKFSLEPNAHTYQPVALLAKGFALGILPQQQWCRTPAF
jgi:hypothetical protein